MRTLLGKHLRTHWVKMSKITLTEEYESSKDAKKTPHLSFRRKSEPDLSHPAYFSIPQYRLDQPISQILEHIRTIPAAAVFLEDSEKKSSGASASGFTFKHALVLVGVLAVGLYFSWDKIRPVFVEPSTVTTRVEINCNRQQGAPGASCELKEFSPEGDKLMRQEDIEGADKLAIENHKYTHLFIASGAKRVLAAIHDRNQTDVDSTPETREALASINQLKSFLEDPQALSVSVVFPQQPLSAK